MRGRETVNFSGGNKGEGGKVDRAKLSHNPAFSRKN